MKQIYQCWLLAVFLATIVAGCAPTRFVKPLVTGSTAIGASVGGPLIKYGKATIPVPMSSIVVGHGFRDYLTGFMGVNTTSLAFGVVQTDIGIIRKLYMQDGWRPAIVLSPVANLMFDKWENKFSFFPQLDGSFYWHYLHKAHYFYLGISNWIDFNTKRSQGDAQKTHWIPIVHVGHRWVTPRWDYVIECKYIAPTHSNRNIVVEYTGIANRGAIGLYFGFAWKYAKLRYK
ncbi:MAG: hypothetical protein V4649_07915 [Bacteroidota bacterium]